MWLISMESRKLFNLLLVTIFLSCQTKVDNKTQRINGFALGTSFSISYSAPQLSEIDLERKVDSIFGV